jgi:hypothetical protein
MRSRAFAQFNISIVKASSLSDTRLLSASTIVHRQIFYHADLAATVAAWDAFIHSIILEYIGCIGDITSPHLLRARELLGGLASERLDRTRAPNFDNARSVLVRCTGYDPIGDWNVPRRGLSWQQVQARLNEILKVRHSFAHGLSLPSCSWMPVRHGKPYLNKRTIEDIRSLIRHLAIKTDSGLARSLKTSFGVVWT